MLSAATDGTGLLSILRRVQVNCDEMPGLALTIPQATRLWRVDAATAEDVLAALVDIGYLCVGHTGFMRKQEEAAGVVCGTALRGSAALVPDYLWAGGFEHLHARHSQRRHPRVHRVGRLHIR